MTKNEHASDPVNLTPLPIASQSSVSNPTVGQRYNRARSLYDGARFFASELEKLEHILSGQDYGPPFDKISWLFSASILSSTASIEASYFEAIVDVGFDAETAKAIERDPILDRFSSLLRVQTGFELKLGETPAQKVQLLISLRNKIAHFKPEKDDLKPTSDHLEQQLKGMKSPVLSDDLLFFPMRCASAARAHWAADTVFEFVRHTRGNLGLAFEW